MTLVGAQGEEHRQELRIALVMNGGVSLAVWMGGVTRELDRVRSSDGVYGQLLDLTNAEARIDVIAGASAGGINGAVLALAIARRTRVDDIRELWMTDGDIENLLRDPLQRDAPSVLNGDAELLRRLREAMKNIGRNPAPGDPSERRTPVHLSITGTLLKGELKTYPDLFGQMVPDVTHHALFHFRRPGIPQEGDPWPDDFAVAADGQADLPAERLALAARSSASFPGAFEPSFVPLGSGGNDMHPDMAGIADFTSAGWLIDGGVLVNTPFRPALDAIRTLPAERPVRRVLGYVVPNPGGSKQPNNGMPSAGEVVFDAMSRLPRVQSVGRELTEIEENNRNVRRRRDARDHSLTALNAEQLKETARLLLPAYVLTRTTSAADDILQALVAATRSSPFPTAEQVAVLRRELRGLTKVPWVPQPETVDELPIGQPWQWGFAPVENAANVSLEVLQRMAHAAGVGANRSVGALRQRMHRGLRQLREIHNQSNLYWQSAAEGLFESGNDTAKALVSGWSEFQDPLGQLALEFAGVVTDAAGEMRRLNVREEDDLLRQMFGSLDGGSAEETLRRLLALDVIQRTSCGDLAGIDQEVELVLMSGDAENAFGLPSRAEDKLAGLQVGHFGAFYKSSWRANDWMWGRLDGADRLVRTLLDPRRVQEAVRTSEGVAAAVAAMRDIACDSGNPQVGAWLASKWSEIEPEVQKELQALGQLAVDPSLTALENCYMAIRRRVQVEIIVDEIPKVAVAVANDRASHAAPDSLGSKWESEYPAGKPLTVDEAVRAFLASHVAEEQIVNEIGSDRFTKVAATTAAVAGSVLGGALPGLKVLKPGLMLIRGLLLTLYLLARGVTESSKTGTFLVALTLALGGALVAIYAIGTHVPGFLLLLGAVILIAGVALAWLRNTRSQIVLFAVILLGSAAGYYGVLRLWHGRPSWVEPLAAIAAVALAAFAATMLGWSGKQATSDTDRL